MATLLWQRDVGSDISGVGSNINGVKTTYSSWDACMTKAYCKWPAIIGIIVGCLLVFSLLWCVFRCLCCGVQCCCGCLACCNACCPSPRGGRRSKEGYYQQPPPPPPPPPQPYPQYQSHAPPMYASGGGYRGAQTATFDVPSKNTPINQDALPAMPSWNNASSRHVEEEGTLPDDVEMEKLQHQTLLTRQQQQQPQQYDGGRYAYPQDSAQAGDMGAMHAHSPYYDYDQQQQYSYPQSAYGQHSAYPSTEYTSPTSTMYEPAGQHPHQQQWGGGGGGGGGGGYAPSLPPSYRTGPPSVVSPPPQRRPVQGSWRDV